MPIDLSHVFATRARQVRLEWFSLVAVLCGVASLIAPRGAAEHPLLRVGALLALAGGVETLHGLRRSSFSAVRRAVTSGLITLLMALLVMNAAFIAGTALVLFLAITFALDAVGHVRAFWRATESRARAYALLAALGDAAVSIALLIVQQISTTWLIALAAALRCFGIAWTMATALVYETDDAARTVVDDLDLGEHDAAALRQQLIDEEQARAPADLRWTLAFVATLFAIHIARMQPDGSLLGFVAPAVAVLGDMLLAVVIALFLFVPVVLSIRSSTRWLERWLWRRQLRADTDRRTWPNRLAELWLRHRLRIGIRLREMRYSLPAALKRSLASGLPVAAVVAATVPIWGMSWFFDTENWASGLWNSWAESRTDQWRAAMVRDVTAAHPANSSLFAVQPGEIASSDFSFIVIGDTGEGDASQHVLRDQLLTVAGRPDVRFLVISSDVVYPNGSMIDYEAKFWLPFKGVTKPVYAIPGNHDWYDALEAFLATFLDAESARLSMRARAEADLRLTSTTDARIEQLIADAAQLRSDYNVPTGFQRAPFFEIQTERFALVGIDTGIVKRIDELQWQWLEAALSRARGKSIMAVVGHPFYAGGGDTTAGNADFTRLKQRLLDGGATILMAGDTHDLEYYVEPPAANRSTIHYIVNGGGGAYLSFGTALAWPSNPATAQWAYYPNREAVSQKIQARTPAWKRPAWWWTTEFGAWPFSAEWLSAAFDYNVAPFFQSFFEVRVEPSSGVIRLRPYGVHGRLNWRDVAHSAGVRPAGSTDDDFVEWIVPMR
jgi:3',5'-cyclic AMP phosphodiesterase CpdA